MAFNLQTFKTRTITALVFAAIMLGGLLLNDWSYLLLFLIVHAGCWIEYQSLLEKIFSHTTPSYLFKIIYPVYGSCLLFYLVGYLHPAFQLITGHSWLILLTVLVLLIEIFLIKKSGLLKRIAFILGIVYITIPCAAMLALRFAQENIQTTSFSADRGFVLPLLLIATIWINDTMAYITGSFLGKTPLTSISPKKTWEGTIGGSVLAILVVTLVCYYWLHIPVWFLLPFTAVTVIAATLGDLFESKLKRLAGVKDSGQILPGHGGFLDRFDSLLFAAVATWLLSLFL